MEVDKKMGIDVYEQIPIMESEKFLLREIEDRDTKDMFACEMIATKAVSIAQERIQALEHMGFSLSEESVIGHNGTKYDSYYVREV